MQTPQQHQAPFHHHGNGRGSPSNPGRDTQTMTDDNDREDKAITRAFTAAVVVVLAGLVSIGGGVFSVANADVTNVNAIAGGWGAMWAGFLLASIGGGVAYGHGMNLRREAQHHELEMHALTQLRDMLAPADEIEQRRSSG